MSIPFSLPPPDAPPVRGVRESAQEMLRGIAMYASARGALLRAEAADATGHLVRVAAAIMVGVVGLGFAYAVGWLGFILWAARHWTQGDLLPPVFGAAGIHLVAGAIALVWLQHRARGQALFQATRQEFEEDQRWLNRRHV